MPSFSELELELKNELIAWSFSSESEAEFSIERVYEVFRRFAGPAVTKQVLQSLIDQNLINRNRWDLDGPEYYEITKELIDEVHRYNEFMNGPSDQIARNKKTPIGHVPASNRTVSLSDNQSKEAVSTLEQVIKEFQKDHHFDNEWTAEKSVLLKALENGRDYLDAKILDVRIGTMMIIEPLQAIADKYKEAAINGSFSALAQKALEFFINLFAG